MCNKLSYRRVGSRIRDLEKSLFPAAMADDQGEFPFYCSSPIVRRIGYASVSGPSILMGTGGVASIHYDDGAYSYSTDTWAFSVVDSETNPKFLYRQLEYLLPEINYSGFYGSGLRHLNKNYIRDIVLPVPSLEEQRRISSCIDECELLIKNNNLAHEKMKAVRLGVMNDLFTRGIGVDGNLRPSWCDAPELYKNSPLGFIPVEWGVSLLDDLSSRGSGHTPRKDVPSYWNGGIKWVSLADSDKLDNLYINDTDKEISLIGVANSSAVVHRSGTVILSRDAGIGRSAILGADMAVSQHFISWECGEKIDNVYLYFCLQFDKPKFESIALGSTIKTIGLPFFESYLIKVPSRKEQDMIAERLLSVEAQVNKYVEEKGKLLSLKRGLLSGLLGSGIVVGV